MKKANETPKRQRKVFDDSESSLLTIASSWQAEQRNKMKTHASTQTPESLFQLQEREIQSGRFTKVVQLQVKEPEKGATLVDYIAEKRPEYKADDWDTKIKDGFVTVDCEVNTDPISTLDTDYFIEYVEQKANKSIQTESRLPTSNLDGPLDHPRVADFLSRVYPLLDEALVANETSHALDILDYHTGSSILDEHGDRVEYWRQLSVDLEKKKILYPDWNRAKYVTGTVVHCAITRNKERVYDIEYDDGAVLTGVKEDYIRLLDDPNDANGGGAARASRTSRRGGNATGGTATGAALASRLQEGVRVHARVVGRNGQAKYLPGRVVKVGRNLFDVEIEGGRVESGLAVADLCIGLSEGHHIEARKPTKTWLHATGVSWNATGSAVAVAYGRLDIAGWCEYPGALCLWNLFSRRSTAAAAGEAASPAPEHVLDHASCLMCVACHPLIPSVVAAGSFNGEVVLWDLAQQDQGPAYTSPIIEYAHKDAVVQLQWVYVQGDATSLASWQLLTLGADGRVLFWSVLNKLQHPLRGFLLTKSRASSKAGGGGGSSSSSGKRQYPLSHGASAAALSGAASSSSSSSASAAASTVGVKPTWLIIGQEGGALVRVQVARLLGGGGGSGGTGGGGAGVITADYLRTLPAVDEVFPSLKSLSATGGGDVASSSASLSSQFQQPQSHVGSVTAVDWSPFHRNLYLTAGSDGVVKLFHTLQPLPLQKLEPAATVPYQRDASSGGGKGGGGGSGSGRSGGKSSGKGSSGGGGGGGSGGANGGGVDGSALGLVAVTAVRFSPIRPSVFAVALADGRIFLYDAYRSDLLATTHATDDGYSGAGSGGGGSSTLLPVQVLYVTAQMAAPTATSEAAAAAAAAAATTAPQGAAVCVTALAFNPKHRDVLCATDWLGRVHMWRLPASLCTRKRDEVSRWERLGRTQALARDDDGDGGSGSSA